MRSPARSAGDTPPFPILADPFSRPLNTFSRPCPLRSIRYRFCDRFETAVEESYPLCPSSIAAANVTMVVGSTLSRAGGRHSPLALQRLILGFTLRRDLGFPWLAQRSVGDTP